MKIEFPYPNMKLSANSKNVTHWSKTIALKNKVFYDAYYLTLESIKERGIKGNIELRITFTQSDKVKRDLDGCLTASKPILDAMASAMKVNDYQFNPITLVRSFDTRSYMTVEIL